MAREIAKLFVTIGVDDKEYKQKLKALDKSIQSIGKTAMVAGAAIVAGIGASIYTWMQAGDEIQKMAKKVSFSTESLSEWKHVLQICGADLSNLQMAVRTMSGAIVDANDGLMTYQRSFEHLGLNYKELIDMAPERAFETIAMAMAGLENSTLRAALAQDIFGRGGMELLPMLEEGAEGIAALRQEAHDLGIVFTQEAADAAAEFKDTMTRLKESGQGLMYAIAEGVAPAIENLAITLTSGAKAISTFAREHKELTKVLSSAILNFGLLAVTLGGIVLITPKIVAGIKAIGTAFKISSSIAGIAASGILVGLTMIATGVQMLMDVGDKFNNQQEAYNKVILEQRKMQAGLANDFYNAAEAYADAYEEYIRASGLGAEEKQERLDRIKAFRAEVAAHKELADAQQATAESAAHLDEKLQGMIDKSYQSNTAAGVLGISLQDVIQYMVDAGREAELLGVNWEYVGEDANKACLEMGISIFDVYDATKTLEYEVARLTAEYNRQVQAINDVADAAIAANNAQIDDIDEQIKARRKQREDERNQLDILSLKSQISRETDANRRAELEQRLADLLRDIEDRKWEDELRTQQDVLRQQNTAIQDNAQNEIDALTNTYNADIAFLNSRLGEAVTFWNSQKALYDQDVLNFQASLDAKLEAARRNALLLQAIQKGIEYEEAGLEPPPGFESWQAYFEDFINRYGVMPKMPPLPSFQGWEGIVPGPIGKPYLAIVHGGETRIEQPGGKGGDIINNFNLYGLIIREEADVQKIARKLYQMQQMRI